MLLSPEQRTGIAILLAFALAAWIGVALYRGGSSHPPQPTAPDTTTVSKPKYRTWEQRKDSMRRVDSLRYARWTEERQQRYDSFRLADSLWKDSVKRIYTPHPKRDTVLDLNRCDTAQLQLIRGIGPYKAQCIVRYREQLGGYYSPAQLNDSALSGLHLDSLLAFFTADTADVTLIPLNAVSVDRLQRHPYLRYTQAKAIYTLRRKRVRLNGLEDLRALPELSEHDLTRLTPYLSFE